MALGSVGALGGNSLDINISNSMRKAKRGLMRSMERLASGFKINSASDDAATLAMAEKLSAEVASLGAAQRNVDYGAALGQVADAAMSSQGDMLVRMRELSVQSANGTLNDSDRAALQTEFNQLREEVDRVASTTQFNGQDLLQGGSTEMQVGTGGSAADRITVNFGDTSAASLSLSGMDIGTQAGAQSAMAGLDSAISSVASARGDMGAAVNRMQSAQNNLSVQAENTAASLSRMMDTDVAAEASAMAMNSNQLRAGISVMKASNRSKGMLVNLIG